MHRKDITIFVIINRKTQNLKAIHNICTKVAPTSTVVINHKTTKFESNSQRALLLSPAVCSCYQSQNYKIWKQFTTRRDFDTIPFELLSITKLQNLKAIHNYMFNERIRNKVVINHKTTKFESNSQPVWSLPSGVAGCYQSQNYKIWKQFTTYCCSFYNSFRLLSITKLQNLKAIHNAASYYRMVMPDCYQSQNYKIWKQFTT